MKTLEKNFKGVVFHYENQIKYLNQKHQQNFTLILCKEYFLVSPFVFYFRKNHFLVDDFNYYLELLQSNGHVGFLSRKFGDDKFLKRDENNGPKVLELGHLYGAFKIYLISNLIAFIVFILEIPAQKIFKFL